MSLATARADLAAVLSEELPDFYVNADLSEPDEITRTTLILVRTKVEKLPSAPLGAHLNSLALYVIVPQHAGEDELDEALEAVLEALDTRAETHWTEATRETFNDANPCYSITLTAHSTRS